MAGRSYIASFASISHVNNSGHSQCNRTEILCVLMGEALILLRINALYGWERKCMLFFFFDSRMIESLTTTDQGSSARCSPFWVRFQNLSLHAQVLTLSVQAKPL